MRVWVRRLLPVVLLALLWRVADGQAALDKLLAADPLWLAAALAALTGQTVLSALRWRLTAARLGASIPAGVAVREYYLSNILNLTLPGGVVGDVGRTIRAARVAGLERAAQAVVFERAAGQVALLAVTGTAAGLSAAVAGGADLPPRLLWGVAAGCAGVLAVGLALTWLGRATARAVPRGPTARALARAGAWARAFAAAVLDRRVLPRQIALSLGTVTANLAAFAFCAQAVGTPLPVTAVPVIVPLILFTMLLPITPNGWGLRESAAAALFPLAGLTAAAGLASGVAFGVMILAAALPGVVLALRARSVTAGT